jgi:hypothetical protein
MTTRAELIALARAELGDQGAAKLWPEAALQRWLAEAIRDYGERLPREATASWTSAAGQTSYPLPADFARALRVEHPLGAYRVHAPAAGGDALDDTRVPPLDPRVPPATTFDVYGGSLVLDPAPGADGEAIALRYLASYPEPAADADVLTTPSRDDELLVWLVCARALEWIATDEAKRMRAERLAFSNQPAAASARYQGRYLEAVRLRTRPLRSARRLVVRT